MPEEITIQKTTPYYYGTGRRKTAVARVWMHANGKGLIFINGKRMEDYFPYFEWQEIVKSPLVETANEAKFDIDIKVYGGGPKAQSEAVRLGIARALLTFDEGLKKALRAKGYLTRDSRAKERKKAGLKRARRAPQWSKR